MPDIKSNKELLGPRYTGEMRQAFPDIAPPFYPFGYLLVLQLQTPKRKSKGGLILADETRDAEKYRTQTALVRCMGPAAFRRRDTMEPWPEGDWCHPGDFVRAPLYGGDRVAVPFGKGDDEAIFITVRDTELIGLVLGDPLDIRIMI